MNAVQCSALVMGWRGWWCIGVRAELALLVLFGGATVNVGQADDGSAQEICSRNLCTRSSGERRRATLDVAVAVAL